MKRNSDGTVTSEIIKQNALNTIRDYEQDMSSFQTNLANIQKAASELVTLQQNIKLTGKLTETDHKLYAENLEKLGVSAQNLAHIQQAGGQDDFRLLFEGPKGNRIMGSHHRDGDEAVETTSETTEDNAEDNVGEQGDEVVAEKPNETDADSVQVNTPDKDASVAEAKPVGKFNICDIHIKFILKCLFLK